MTQRIFAYVLLFAAAAILLSGQSALAEGKDYGEPCTSNSDCASGGCEEAEWKDTDDTGKYFCDCGDSAVFSSLDVKYCATKFGSAEHPNEKWQCKDGTV